MMQLFPRYLWWFREVNKIETILFTNWHELTYLVNTSEQIERALDAVSVDSSSLIKNG